VVIPYSVDLADGDNIQWLLNDFATSPNWYGSKRRGEMNLGWTVSPALSQLAPPGNFYHCAVIQERSDVVSL
jgi:hypothetical protein